MDPRTVKKPPMVISTDTGRSGAGSDKYEKGSLDYMGEGQEDGGKNGGERRPVNKMNKPRSSLVPLLATSIVTLLISAFLIYQMAPSKGDLVVVKEAGEAFNLSLTTAKTESAKDRLRIESLITSMGNYAPKTDLVNYTTKIEAGTHATKAELATLATRAELEGLRTTAFSSAATQTDQAAKLTAQATEIATLKTALTDLTTKVTALSSGGGSSGGGVPGQPSGSGIVLTNNGVTSQITNGPVIYVTPGTTAVSQPFYVRLANTSTVYKYINLSFSAATYGGAQTNLTTSTLTCLTANTVTYIATPIPAAATCSQVLYTPTGVKCTMAPNTTTTIAFIVSATTVAASQWTFDLSSMAVTDTY